MLSFFTRRSGRKKEIARILSNRIDQDIIEAEEIISNAVDVIINTFEITMEKNISGVKNG